MGSPLVLRARPVGMTIGRLMGLSVVIALGLWITRPDSMTTMGERIVAIGIAALIVARILGILHYAKRCPVCGKGPVARVAAVPFGDHFFRCTACGQRSKRLWLGRLWDASGTDDDRHYRKGAGVSAWEDGPIFPSAETPETRTVGSLLRGKLKREADAPEPVEIATGEAGWSAEGKRGNPPPHSANRPASIGVKQSVADGFFRTLDAIRWTRNSRR